MTFHDKISNIMKRIFYFIFVIGMTIPAYAKLSAAQFPMTAQDLSFKSRVEIATEGYKPFLDKKAYQELNIVPGEEFYTDRIIAEMEAENRQQTTDAQTMPLDEYCAKYPYDDTKCPRPTEPSETAQQTPQTEPQSQQQTQQQTYFSGRTIGGGPVVENNYVTGGSCYPAARVHSVLPNTISTTGKYEKIHPAFEKGLISVFRKEGKCGKIRGDHCGYTCYGISECSGVRVSSPAEAEEVYYKQYWKPKKLEKLPDVIATDIFLASMGSGVGTAMQHLRKFLGLPIKATPVDDAVIKAINNYNGDIHNDWMNAREIFLMKVADEYLRKYGTDIRQGYKNSIDLKRKNGCHVRPSEPLYR